MTLGYPLLDAMPCLQTGEHGPGFYRISHDAYHGGIGLSSTKVKRALVSYGHYMTPQDDTEALAFGRAFHTALLEPELFERAYVVMPDFSEHGHYNSKAHKDAKAAWTTENEGREVIKQETVDQIMRMVAAVHRHQRWKDFKGYDPEIMATGLCPDTRRQLKCKMDLYGSVIVDFKTTGKRATPSQFRKDVLDYGYHISSAFYSDIVQQVSGVKHRFVFAVVEKAQSGGVAFYELDDEYLAKGRQLYRAALRRIDRWMNMDAEIPLSYGDAIHRLSADARLLYKTNETLADMELA